MKMTSKILLSTTAALYLLSHSIMAMTDDSGSAHLAARPVMVLPAPTDTTANTGSASSSSASAAAAASSPAPHGAGSSGSLSNAATSTEGSRVEHLSPSHFRIPGMSDDDFAEVREASLRAAVASFGNSSASAAAAAGASSPAPHGAGSSGSLSNAATSTEGSRDRLPKRMKTPPLWTWTRASSWTTIAAFAVPGAATAAETNTANEAVMAADSTYVLTDFESKDGSIALRQAEEKTSSLQLRWQAIHEATESSFEDEEIRKLICSYYRPSQIKIPPSTLFEGLTFELYAPLFESTKPLFGYRIAQKALIYDGLIWFIDCHVRDRRLVNSFPPPIGSFDDEAVGLLRRKPWHDPIIDRRNQDVGAAIRGSSGSVYFLGLRLMLPSTHPLSNVCPPGSCIKRCSSYRSGQNSGVVNVFLRGISPFGLRYDPTTGGFSEDGEDDLSILDDVITIDQQFCDIRMIWRNENIFIHGYHPDGTR